MSDQARDRVLFGAAYYPEYQPERAMELDLDLMAQAHFSVIRVGESVWSTWEPEEGRFDLEWLAPVLDGAHARGIRVVLGTPTYAVPLWLARRYPEIAGEHSTGRRTPWGGRQEVDFTHAAFRFHAERVVRKVVARYAQHPAVIGFQVDNEPGIMALHNTGVFARFVDQLRHRYGDVDTLNTAWGLTYWSHRLSTWADLWTPEGNWQPQYDLAWRTFQAQLTTEFIAWQAGIVREHAREDQFVTTCIAYARPGVDDVGLTRALDVTAGNPYYAMQDHLHVPHREGAEQGGWITAGTWGLFQSADRMYASKQAPYLITETNAGSIGGPAMNHPAYDGQWRQAAWAFVSRGAEMIEYWHWQTAHFGTETYWGGVLPHDRRPGRVYAEIARLGSELAAAGDRVVGLRPDAQVGIVYSSRSKWGLAYQSPFPAPGVVFSTAAAAERDPQSYEHLFGAFYRGIFDAGRSARTLHDDQIVDEAGAALLDPATVAQELPVLVVAGLFVASDALLEWLRAYAAAGGHLVLGPRTGYGDLEGRARTEVKPALLDEAAGVHYQEFSNITEPLTVVGQSEAVVLPEGSAATRWIDGLVADGAQVLLAYDHPHFAQFPAVVTTAYGSGRITTVGTVPDPELAEALIGWAAPACDSAWGRLPASVTVHSATNAAGERVHVAHNWSWDPAVVHPDLALLDALDSDKAVGERLELGAWDVRVLIEDRS